ncbi:MAG: bifunctional (p)ppGpp synthetase/guanosine-3',5'-bis(diphosphate) 3'-pyrophosphohydrolase [Firmicutes bacterium]|nr:bifunctional (p)ppGpp synthetase/guanosine-3',5'-bis(diphosphate) 3'-pyrophosphohydrolase [Bacillota bacterium]
MPDGRELARRMRAYLPEGFDVSPVERAYDLAERAHAGQLRLSGEPYLVHPVAVAEILVGLQLDVESVTAALLHDVVEDTPVTLAELEAAFGAEVAALVDGVTKLSQIKFRSTEEEQAGNLRKMLLAMARDIRVILIKLADRLHNMRTLRYLPPSRQRAIAHETLEIFAPLAHRLGISQIKSELEDLAFRTLEPEVYAWLKERVADRRQEREAYLAEAVALLKAELARAGVEAEVDGRRKNFYSIYTKMQRGKEFEEIYDLLAVRVLVHTVRECYGALGVVHSMWRPLPGRVKDYIAMPKPNLYQSLHTTVVGPHGRPFEIQIRTWEMHRTAEYGIAAHWLYKERARPEALDEKLAWLRQVLDWQHDMKDAREFMESLRVDLFSDQVFVFTPKGAVIDLPAGSTPVDFAYRIHTDIGHHAVGAKANGRIVPLNSRLQNGDIVEIMVNPKSAGPSPDWLEFVRTSGARGKIRQFLRNQNRAQKLEEGRAALEREARRLGLEPGRVLTPEALLAAGRRFRFESVEELLLAVAAGGISPGQLLPRPEPAPPPEVGREGRGSRPSGGAAAVRVDGVDNPLVRFARCCQPVPGDEIVGYVTRGRGVTIHRRDCANAVALRSDQARLMPVTWGAQAPGLPVELAVLGTDRPGLLAGVAQACSDLRINIYSAQAHSEPDGRAVVELVVEVRHLGELSRLEDRLERLPDVYSVVRRTRRDRRRNGQRARS